MPEPETSPMPLRFSQFRRLLPLLAVLALAAGALSGCGAAGTPDPVAEAAAATAKAGGARVEMKMSFEVPGRPGNLEMTATGVTDQRNGDGQLTLDMSAMAALTAGPGQSPSAADLDTEVRMKDKVIYMRMGLLAGLLPKGKRWIKLDTRDASAKLGIDFDRLTQYNDPAKVLEYLDAAGDVKKVGQEQVRGVDTTHYRANVDLRELLKSAGSGSGSDDEIKAMKELMGADTMPIEVWISDDKLVRRMAMDIGSASGSAGAAAFKMTMRMDIFDYGIKVSVKVPPASQVADAASLGLPGVTAP